ncbi:hypothetical protein CEUSTIGMA_g6022.t1 [Chlamydomonas eustigma]|uniref:PPM-type phosphatase domain-containing protein n=1 Tax=Chlamydomonas eustigma TaxID=1157962 RepID=A0A250X679_9CHLO|nr:hypothetical protein CEUSTIGMA_g6022.t1 [Chlamydomonas eustigma]|eukprot:GAX78583.1 hypothetical protein CEUSTIGMA_g6022.t1 [Chlamydomonas eustigma]
MAIPGRKGWFKNVRIPSNDGTIVPQRKVLVPIQHCQIACSAVDESHLNKTSSPSAPCAIVYQGFSSVKGLLKSENQDRVVAIQNLSRQSQILSHNGSSSQFKIGEAVNSGFVFGAVFDGHGGSSASTHAAERIQHMVSDDHHVMLKGLADVECVGEDCGALRSSWPAQPYDSSAEGTSSSDSLELSMWREAFSRLDAEILDRSRDSGVLDGATALAAIHAGQLLTVANAGDSRALLGRGSKALRLTRDHTPGDKYERARIESAGGTVRHLKGAWRVLLPFDEGKFVKLCATSRGLGDRDYKEEGLLICEPEVTSVMLQPHLDTFSVLASDGLWAFVEDQQVVDMVNKVIAEFSQMTMAVNMQAVAKEAARKLVRLALDHGSVDDITVLVHLYDWGP